mmetsp:Transcript_63896/g.185262  ORF Transcript_63896/g.185262 Transcript_63896/m.185262 type:complete len:307 (-) Transcript_63896:185-1105(-)
MAGTEGVLRESAGKCVPRVQHAMPHSRRESPPEAGRNGLQLGLQVLRVGGPPVFRVSDLHTSVDQDVAPEQEPRPNRHVPLAHDGVAHVQARVQGKQEPRGFPVHSDEHIVEVVGRPRAVGVAGGLLQLEEVRVWQVGGLVDEGRDTDCRLPLLEEEGLEAGKSRAPTANGFEVAVREDIICVRCPPPQLLELGGNEERVSPPAEVALVRRCALGQIGAEERVGPRHAVCECVHVRPHGPHRGLELGGICLAHQQICDARDHLRHAPRRLHLGQERPQVCAQQRLAEERVPLHEVALPGRLPTRHV